MVLINCEQCRKEFNAKPSRINRSKRAYCSRACYAQHKKEWFVSPTTGKKRTLTPGWIAKLRVNAKKGWAVRGLVEWSEQEDVKLINLWKTKSPELIEKEMNRSKQAIEQRRIKLGLASPTGKVVKKRQYDVEGALKKKNGFAYFLGLLITDGHLNKQQVSFEMIEPDINEVQEFLAKLFNVKDVPSWPRKKRSHFMKNGTQVISKIPARTAIVSCKRLQTILNEQYQIPMGNKTFTVRMPKINEDQFWAFLRGVIDGDGCVTSKYQITISSASKEFLQDLKDELERRKVNSSIYTEKKRTDAHKLGIGKDRQIIYKELSKIPFGLKRKNLMFKRI